MGRNWNFLLCLCFVTCLTGTAFSQYTPSPKFYRIDNTQGLSQNTVYQILQDKQGFMWLATEHGINRFDGIDFKVFNHDNTNPLSLSNNSVLNLTEDRSGYIWVATNGSGASRLDKKTGRFRHYCDSSDNKNMYVNNAVWCIEQGQDNDFWLGTFGGGLKKLNASTGRFLHFPSTHLNDVRSIVSESNGKLWLGTFDGGLCSFDPVKNRFTTYLNEGEALKILRLKLDKNLNCLWIATVDNGVYRFDLASKKYTHLAALKGIHVRDILSDPKNPHLLWLATWGKGIACINHVTGAVLFFEKNKNEEFALADNLVLSLYCDQTGLIWAGTYNAGISKVNIFPDKFNSYHLPDGKNISASNVIYSVSEINNQILTGTQTGEVYYKDAKTNEFFQLRSPDKNQSLSVVYCLLPDNGNKLWYGTGNGLFLQDIKTGKSIVYLPDSANPRALSYPGVTAAYKDRSGQLWFGTYGGGLNRFDAKTNDFTVFKNIPGDKTSLPENTVYDIREDSRGRLWLGTGKGGLCLMNRKTGKFTRFNNPEIAFGEGILTLAEDSKGTVWAGTSNGLVQLTTDKNNRISTRLYTTQDNLPSNYIAGILVDHKDRIWLSSTNGICQFTPPLDNATKPTVVVYGREDGLKNLEFLNGSCFKGQSGNYYFGSVDGIVAFNPDRLFTRNFPCQTVITSLRIFNKPVELDPSLNGLKKINDNYYLPADISSISHLTLSYEESVFSFDFTLLDLLFPRKNKFAYKMEGFEKDWNYVNRRSTTYTNLAPGEYTFRVKAANNDGNWVGKEAVLHITITPPWWATWWFRILAVVTLSFTIIYIVRRRFQKLKLDKHQLEIKVEERTREISEQRNQLVIQADELQQANEKLLEMDAFKENLTTMLVHDLKNPLGSIVHLSSADRDNEQNQLIEQSARQMLNLVMNLLEVQKLKESKIDVNLQPVDLNELIQNSIAYLALSADQKNVQLMVEVPIDTRIVCDAHLMERVLINLTANAIYYSPQNERVILKAVIDPEKNTATISVKDFGKGIAPEKLKNLFSEHNQVNRSDDKYSTGIGLQYCQWALAAHKCNLNVMSQFGAGSEFYFSLPLSGANRPSTTMQNINKTSLPLTESDIAQLLSSTSRLRSLQVYEGGKILTLLKELPETNENILQWKLELKKAVYAINESYYSELLTLIDKQ